MTPSRMSDAVDRVFPGVPRVETSCCSLDVVTEDNAGGVLMTISLDRQMGQASGMALL